MVEPRQQTTPSQSSPTMGPRAWNGRSLCFPRLVRLPEVRFGMCAHGQKAPSTRNCHWAIASFTAGLRRGVSVLPHKLLSTRKRVRPGVSMQKDAEAENKRLLYVGLTRARDVNVLVSFARKAGPVRSWVDEVPGASQILFGPTDEVVLADGQRCSRTSKDWNKDECAAEPPVQAPQDRHWFIRRPRASAAPLWHRPSSAVGGQFTIAETADVVFVLR